MKFDEGDYACIATETFCDPVFSALAVVEIKCELSTTVYICIIMTVDILSPHNYIQHVINNADSD